MNITVLNSELPFLVRGLFGTEHWCRTSVTVSRHGVVLEQLGYTEPPGEDNQRTIIQYLQEKYGEEATEVR